MTIGLANCFILYWILIYPTLKPGAWWALHLHQVLVHINPIVSLYLVYWTCDIKQLVADHCKVIIPVHFVYDLFNLWGTKMIGRPLYWFLTWESYPESICVCVAVMCYTVWGWLATSWYLGKPVKKEEKKDK